MSLDKNMIHNALKKKKVLEFDIKYNLEKLEYGKKTSDPALDKNEKEQKGSCLLKKKISFKNRFFPSFRLKKIKC